MLQLILGRAGSGKTHFVFSQIKKLVNSNEKNILLITPEQFSFSAQKRLLLDLGESKVNEVEESSFSRLCDSVSKVCGGNELPVLSSGAKAVMMKKAIETVQDSLSLFSNSITNISFINLVIKVYDEMKSCRVSSEDILKASDESEKELLSLKLKDIALIISAYDALIKNEYYDSANELTRLYEKLLTIDYFKDRTVFIDGFSGFVAQEYKIIEVILKQAKKVYITFCTDSYNNTDRFNLFSYVNSNILILREVAAKMNTEVASPVFLSENKRAKNEDIALVEKNIFESVVTKKKNDVNNVRLYNSANIIDECDFVSKNISSLLRQGYKASDISVVCRDIEKYQSEITSSFTKYNIPYFDDERQKVNSQPLIMFVNFLLRCVINSYKSEDIFSLLKTGLCDIQSEEISNLENYVYLWNINGSKWKNEFTESTKGFVEEITKSDAEKLKIINQSREYIVSRIIAFQKNVKHANCKQICKAVYKTLIDFSVDKKLKELAVSLDKEGKGALAQEQSRIWDLLMDVLDSLALIGGENEITLSEFYKLYSLMILNEELGSVPIGLDNVQFGSADRIRFDNPKAVFVLGANEGEFPQSVVSSGLISESDRITLIKNNFKLYSYGETLNAQEKYFAYMAVSAPSEKLFITYNSYENSGYESSIVRGITNIFPNIKKESKDGLLDISMLESRDNAFEVLSSNYESDSEFIASLKAYFENEEDYSSRLKALNLLALNEDIVIKDRELARSLFKNNMYLSASRIEDYYNCSFRYFCKFGLGARPRQKAQMDPMQTGTVIHYVLEQIIKNSGSKNLAQLSDEEITILVNKYLEEYLYTKMGDAELFTARFKYQFLRLSKMLISVVMRLRSEFEQCDFEARAFELTIGDGSQNEEVKSQVIKLDDGGSIEIKGAVDRVDTYYQNGKQYVRVVDYKSGNKDFMLTDILNGLNLQMFIYLFTVCKSNTEYGGTESGVLYMHSSRNIFPLDRHSDSEQINKEENRLFKMKGVVLNDSENEIAQHMEHSLKGRYIPVKVTSKGLSGNIVTLEELGLLSKKINSLIKNMGTNLHSGIISQNPVDGNRHDRTCEFCDYSDVCMNRKEINKKELIDVDNAKVIEIIKEEQDA